MQIIKLFIFKTIFFRETIIGYSVMNSAATQFCMPLFLINFVISAEIQNNSIFHISLNVKHVFNVVNDKFLSVTLDSGILTNPKKWKSFNISSPVLQVLSENLSPSYLRVGGTSSDYITYQSSPSQNPQKYSSNFIGTFNQTYELLHKTNTFTEYDWMKLNRFSKNSNWSLIFDLNALLRNKDGSWDHRNALKLFTDNEQLGFRVNWELGNELNSHKQIPGCQLGKDFVFLKQLLQNFTTTKSSLLFGPDISSSHPSSLIFLNKFLNCASDVLDAVTFHEYYLRSENATLQDFLDHKVFDNLISIIKAVRNVVCSHSPKAKIWLGETGTASGGGAKGLSDTYVAGFLWLDKLGLSAVNGIDAVFRQSFIFSYYGLITEDYEPLPDYWLSLLYKWLVGRRVLKVHSIATDSKIRTYAHCTFQGRLYNRKGAVTFFAINLHNVTVKLKMIEPVKSHLHEYLLESAEKDNLQSRKVKLNGNILSMNHTSLPKIFPKIKNDQSLLILPPFTFGFFVFPNAKAPACM